MAGLTGTGENLQEVSVALGRHIPATLNLEQQSYLRWVITRWEQSSIKERKEAVAASKERTAVAEQ